MIAGRGAFVESFAAAIALRVHLGRDHIQRLKIEFRFISLTCLIAVWTLAGCGTLTPSSPTRANDAQPTSPAVITSAPQPASTSELLRPTMPAVPTASQPKSTPPAAVSTLPPVPPGASGIEGQSLVGPTCPVVRLDQPCPDNPYQAKIIVLNQSGAEVKRFETDAEGRFRIELPPGTYTLVPQSPGVLPRGEKQIVQVRSGQFTAVTVTYDSGIR